MKLKNYYISVYLYHNSLGIIFYERGLIVLINVTIITSTKCVNLIIVIIMCIFLCNKERNNIYNTLTRYCWPSFFCATAAETQNCGLSDFEYIVDFGAFPAIMLFIVSFPFVDLTCESSSVIPSEVYLRIWLCTMLTLYKCVWNYIMISVRHNPDKYIVFRVTIKCHLCINSSRLPRSSSPFKMWVCLY